MRLRVFSASGAMREDLERRSGPVASDACVIVAVEDCIIGWGDDYGTFHPNLGFERMKDAAEALLEAACDTWEALAQ